MAVPSRLHHLRTHFFPAEDRGDASSSADRRARLRRPIYHGRGRAASGHDGAVIGFSGLPSFGLSEIESCPRGPILVHTTPPTEITYRLSETAVHRFTRSAVSPRSAARNPLRRVFKTAIEEESYSTTANVSGQPISSSATAGRPWASSTAAARTEASSCRVMDA